MGNHNVNGKVVTPTPRKLVQRVPGYVSRHRDTAASKAATRDRVSLRRRMIVFSNKGSAPLIDLFLRLGHDCEVRIYHKAQARTGFPTNEILSFPFPCSFDANFNLEKTLFG